MVATTNGTLRLWRLDDAAGSGGGCELAPTSVWPLVSEWCTRGFSCALSSDGALALTCTWDRALQVVTDPPNKQTKTRVASFEDSLLSP